MKLLSHKNFQLYDPKKKFLQDLEIIRSMIMHARSLQILELCISSGIMTDES